MIHHMPMAVAAVFRAERRHWLTGDLAVASIMQAGYSRAPTFQNGIGNIKLSAYINKCQQNNKF
jgi:hypothetical protein